MMTKILFVVLLGCACVLAAPASQSTEVEGNEPTFSEKFVNSKIGQAIINIFKALLQPFKNIWQKLNTPEFIEAIEELGGVQEKILDDNNEIKTKDEATKKALEDQIDNVEKAFEKLFAEAQAKAENNEDGKVDASGFKNAVHELKVVADKAF